MKDGRTYRRHLFNRLVDCHVPEHLHEGLIEYLTARRPVGHFLTAVLSNNLRETCVRADEFSRERLVEIVLFLLNYAPSDAWGSDQAVVRWIEAYPEPVPELYE